MRYALIDTNGMVLAVQDVESPDYWTYPEDLSLVEADGWYPEHDASEYFYKNGEFVWHEPDPEPFSPWEALQIAYAAMPSLTEKLSDQEALRMIPYLPQYDSTQTYAVGALIVKDGDVLRKTRTGWRIIT